MNKKEQAELEEQGFVICEDLDRFSSPMPWESPGYQFDTSNVYEVEKVVLCQGCGGAIDLKEDEYLSSIFWEDEYIHDVNECFRKYYEQIKRPEQAEQV